MHLVTSVASARSDDKTYYLFPVALWTIAEIASGIVCGCLITMPHFFRHFAPKIASKLSLSRSRGSGPSKLASFLPVRATVRAKNPPEWSGAAYDSASRGAKDDYMELGESNTWRGGPAATVVRVHDDDAGHGAAGRGRVEWGARGPVSHLPSNVTSIYSVDYPSAER
ncbi:hypothetical protein IMSHALPRED_001968 [Imshaugia aleurites]|uniref:Rhodopsin domain-containing protein n=1 Tax=Imshaugia aleurites TaxID=172621 RepID=A0A8H3EZB2_9LECA|nr:hypothetical protein IMSHALPRED_001968 [Imshaugia aleurites]